jgi:hypothetical protein
VSEAVEPMPEDERIAFDLVDQCTASHDHPDMQVRVCVIRELRARDWTYRRIGRTFGIDATRAWQLAKHGR